jgi:ATP-dependent exoDNAse (exonuclease V) beta subunit
VADDLRLAAIRYLPALAGREGLEGTVRVHALPDADERLEAASIVHIVREARARKADASVAVLVAARRRATPIAAALQGAGFSVRGLKLEPLRERPVVRELCALGRALQHPGDRTAWLSLLHGPCCGLTLEELQQLCEDQPAGIPELLASEQQCARLAPAARARLERVRTALQPALQGPERSLPLWQRVDHAWLRLGGPAACLEQRDLVDAQAFLRALSEQRDAEWLAGDAFDHFTGELYAAAPTAPGAVEILTMHGAKGLEWDVVIVPGLGRSVMGESEPLLHWVELPAAGGDTQLLLAPINDAAQLRERSVADYIRRLHKQRREVERTRLLYVAATRAKRELHWLGAAVPNAKGELRPRAHTLLALLWPAIGAEFSARHAIAVVGAAAGTVAQGAAAVLAPGAQRLRSHWRPTGLPPAVNVDAVRLSLHEAGDTPEYSWVGLAARAVGTIVHAELQRLAAAVTLPAALDRVAADYQAWLIELGVADAELPAAAERIVTALARTLADARGRWLLTGSAPGTAYSELRLTGRHEGRVINVIIDRLLHDERGDCWIVDYKTSAHEGGDVDAFLDREAERYRPQLQRYAQLMREPGGPRLRAALYFPLLGEFREIALVAPERSEGAGQ